MPHAPIVVEAKRGSQPQAMPCRAAISASQHQAADRTPRTQGPRLRSPRVRRTTGRSSRAAPVKGDLSDGADIELLRSPDATNRRRPSFATLGSVLAIGVGLGWLAAAQWGPSPKPAALPQVTTVADVELAPAAQPELLSPSRLPALMHRDGMYLVGTDLEPGRYVATGTGSVCYYATVTDLSGSLKAVVTTHFGDAWGRRVELNDGEYFETDACGTWLFEASDRNPLTNRTTPPL